uniref:ATPase, T2SS/T4P/T4SS family n=1 Tax=Acidiphilium angustum TaxID=523 RepID=UPI0011158AB7|nr:hypothetical protein [Acidiphilium angustum]
MLMVSRGPDNRPIKDYRKFHRTILSDPSDNFDRPIAVQEFLRRAVQEGVSELFFGDLRPVVAKIDWEFCAATNHLLTPQDLRGLRKFLFGDHTQPASPHRHWHKIGRVHLRDKEYLRYEVTETEIHDASELRGHEIVLRLLPNVLPDIEFYELDRELRDHLPRSGLVLVSGGADSDATGLIAALVRWVVEDRSVEHRAVIYALTDYSFTQELRPIAWEKSSILQVETPPGEPLNRAMVQATAIGADVVAIGACRDPATMEIALALAAEGKRVFVGVGTSGVMNTVARVLALLSRGRGEDHAPGLPELALNLRTIISQKMVRNQQGSISALQEYLIVGPPLREALLQTAPSGWPLPFLTYFEAEGESFAACASVARNAGVISTEVFRRVVAETTAPIITRRPARAAGATQAKKS